MNDKRLRQRGLKNGKQVWTGRARSKRGDGPTHPRFTYIGNKKDAERAWIKWLSSIEDGSFVPTDRSTFGHYLDEFLAGAKATLARKTWERFEGMARIHVIPKLGRLPLQKLTTVQLNKAYAEWRESGLAGQTVIHHHRLIHRVLAQALREGRVRQNVAAIADKPKAPRREMRCLSTDEIDRVMAAAAGTDLAAPIGVALACGARRGELLGLKWIDVDFERGTLAIRRSLEQVRVVRAHDAHGAVVAETFVAEKPPKSGKPRVVVLPASAVELMRELRRERARTEGHIPTGYIFPDPKGGGAPWAPHKVTDAFRDLARKAGLVPMSARATTRAGRRAKATAPKRSREQRPPTITFHTLRHTCASLLLAQGVHPKIVQEMLGHSSVAITMDLYSHVTPSLQTEAAQRLDAILGPSLVALRGRGA
jgi:integrase